MKRKNFLIIIGLSVLILGGILGITKDTLAASCSDTFCVLGDPTDCDTADGWCVFCEGECFFRDPPFGCTEPHQLCLQNSAEKWEWWCNLIWGTCDCDSLAKISSCDDTCCKNWRGSNYYCSGGSCIQGEAEACLCDAFPEDGEEFAPEATVTVVEGARNCGTITENIYVVVKKNGVDVAPFEFDSLNPGPCESSYIQTTGSFEMPSSNVTLTFYWGHWNGSSWEEDGSETHTIIASVTCDQEFGVFDTDNNPISGAKVEIDATHKDYTDDSGVATIEDLTVGTDYTATITKTGYEPGTESFTACTGRRGVTLYKESCDQQFRVENENGNPLDTDVSVLGVTSCSTGIDGECSITLEKGKTYTASASKSGYVCHEDCESCFAETNCRDNFSACNGKITLKLKSSVCNYNGEIDPGEICDCGLGKQNCSGDCCGYESCVSLGFSGGTLACENCTFDTSGCTEAVSCFNLGGTCCDPDICAEGKITGASDCVECCSDIANCQAGPTPEVCGPSAAPTEDCNSNCDLCFDSVSCDNSDAYCEWDPEANGGKCCWALETKWPETPSGTKLTGCSNLPIMIKYFYEWGISLGGFVAFIVLIIAGFQYLASVGSPEAMREAMGKIKSAFLGLILLLSAWLILDTINPELTILRVPGVEEVTFPPPRVEDLITDYKIDDKSCPGSKAEGKEVVVEVTITNNTGSAGEFRIYLFDNDTQEEIDHEPDTHWNNLDPGEDWTDEVGTEWKWGAMPDRDLCLRIEAREQENPSYPLDTEYCLVELAE